MSLGVGMLLGLAAGVLAGLFLPGLAIQPLWGALGELWFNGLRMIVIPIVTTQLVLGLNANLEGPALRRLGLAALGWFLGLLTLASGLAAVLTPIFLRFVNAATPAAAGPALAPIPTFADWIAGLLPANLFKAATENQLLALILFSVLFGLAVRAVAEDRRRILLGMTAAVRDAMLVITGWVLVAAPLGIAALTAPAVARMGGAVVGSFGLYVAYFSGLLLLLTAVLYPLGARRVGWRRWASAVAPVQALAIGSRSSMATLPVQVAAAERQLKLQPAVTGFVLPLAVSVFRYTAPAGQVSGALFVAHLYGVPLGAADVLAMVVTSVLLSLSAPGIPSSGLLVALPLFQQLGLPAEGLGMLIAADAIPDMFKTMANVTAHMTVASVLDGES